MAGSTPPVFYKNKYQAGGASTQSGSIFIFQKILFEINFTLKKGVVTNIYVINIFVSNFIFFLVVKQSKNNINILNINVINLVISL